MICLLLNSDLIITDTDTESKADNDSSIMHSDDAKQPKKDNTDESGKERTEVRKEGFLEKKSLLIGKFRKRLICLNNNNHLFCYKSEQKIDLTENIDLGFLSPKSRIELSFTIKNTILHHFRPKLRIDLFWGKTILDRDSGRETAFKIITKSRMQNIFPDKL